jgi:hypothetical protein
MGNLHASWPRCNCRSASCALISESVSSTEDLKNPGKVVKVSCLTCIRDGWPNSGASVPGRYREGTSQAQPPRLL